MIKINYFPYSIVTPNNDNQREDMKKEKNLCTKKYIKGTDNILQLLTVHQDWNMKQMSLYHQRAETN